MTDSAPRFIAIVVGVCVALSILVILRSRQAATPPPQPVPGSIRGPQVARKEGPGSPAQSTGQSSGSSLGNSRGSSSGSGSIGRADDRPEPARPGEWSAGEGSGRGIAPLLGEAGENTVASRDGRRLAAEPLPPTGDEGEETFRGSSFGSAFTSDIEGRPDLPEGTKFALSSDGGALAADGTEPLVEENVYYDVGEGIYFPTDARLAYPDKGGVVDAGGTVAFWVQPVDWEGKDPTDNSFFQLRNPESWSNRLQVFKNGVYLRFLLTTNSGQETNVGQPISSWVRGEWHFVTASWGESVMTLYVDGVPVGRAGYDGELEVPEGTPAWWGSDVRNGTPGAGTFITGQAVWDRVLAREEIASMAQEVPTVK